MHVVLEKMTKTLADEIKERALEKRPFTSEEINRFGLQIVKGLLHLQELRTWHQDLKPSNILIDKEGTYKLADFGGSKAMIGTTKSAPSIVKSDFFAAPEIEKAWLEGSLAKLPFKDLIASDVYSLGKVLQCMVSLSPTPERLDSAALEVPYRNLISGMISELASKRLSLAMIQDELIKLRGSNFTESEENKRQDERFFNRSPGNVKRSTIEKDDPLTTETERNEELKN